MKNWKDTTSYRPNEKDVEPRTWQYPSKHMRLIVTRMHATNGWFMHARELGISSYKLDHDDIEGAKEEAIETAQNVLRVMLNELS